MRHVRALVVLAWTGLLAGASCAPPAADPAYRYRLTAEVDTPRGLRTGSGVIEVQPCVMGPHAADMPVKGEAVPVDLPGGRTLFMLLWIIHWIVRTKPFNALPMAEQVRRVAATRGLLLLPATMPEGAGPDLADRDPRPTLATFADPRRRATLRIVDADDLAATFGPGTALRRITLQVTDDPVTSGIQQRLPWLQRIDGSIVPATSSAPEWRRELSVVTRTWLERQGRPCRSGW